MKTTFEAKFPGCHEGQVTTWRFEWIEEGFDIFELSKSFRLRFSDQDDSFVSCPSFAVDMEPRLPGGILNYLSHLWREIEMGHSEDGIQLGFDSLGQWCIACEQAVPRNEFWEEFNGRDRLVELAEKNK